MNIVIVPKRKTLQAIIRDRGGSITNIVQPVVVPDITIPPSVLSNLLIDCNKNWAGYSIENIGSPSDIYGAISKSDILAAIEFIIDGSGGVITTGQKGHIRLPFAGTIISAALAADQSGSIVVDIWKNTLANFPPTNADSITASAPPTLTSAQVMLDSTLTGWTKTFSYGDFLAFNVDSCSVITRGTLTLVVRRE